MFPTLVLLLLSQTSLNADLSVANKESVGEAEPISPPSLPEPQRENVLRTAPLSDFEVRASDQIWTVSSRSICQTSVPTDRLQINRRSRDARWLESRHADFLASNSDGVPRRTVVYVHGNLTPHSKALRDGLATYDQTFLSWEEAPPVRFVIWSWPSTQVTRGVRDVRLKASYAQQHAHHLARWLASLPQGEQVSVIGYSYGARLSINALNILASNSTHQSAGQPGTIGADPRAKVNLTLVAGGIRNDCFSNTHWRALTKVNHMFVLYNSRDQFLRFYRLLRFDGKRDALGYTGVHGIRPGFIDWGQIEQFDASVQVGREHSYLDYVVDRRVENLLRKNLFAIGP